MKERLLKRFYDEIAVLEREVKVDLPKEIQRARELGDLRENAEYKAAKERQDIVNVRISMIGSTILMPEFSCSRSFASCVAPRMFESVE